jgi:hypothetical protein
VRVAFWVAGFSKRIKKMISRFCFKALKIHNLSYIAPKLMKQILLGFLGVDLQYKIIARQF